MQLRMVARRSLSGSMTVVGDIAQATGTWVPGVVVAGGGAPAGPPGLAPGRAHRQLPHARRDHGDGGPDPRAGGAGHAGPRRGPGQRPPAPDHPGRPAGGIVPRRRPERRHRPGRCGASSTDFRDRSGRHGGRHRAAHAPRPGGLRPRRRRHRPSGRSASGRSTSGSPCSPSRTPRAWSSIPSRSSSRLASSGRRAQGLRALYVAFTRATQLLSIVHADALPAPVAAALRHRLRRPARPAASGPRGCDRWQPVREPAGRARSGAAAAPGSGVGSGA